MSDEHGDAESHRSIWAMIYAEAWKNPEFKRRYEKDPIKTIQEFIKERNLDEAGLGHIGDKPSALTEDDIKKMKDGDASPLARALNVPHIDSCC